MSLSVAAPTAVQVPGICWPGQPRPPCCWSYTDIGDSGDLEKGRSLASRLLSKKASKRTDKLTFGSNAQVGAELMLRPTLRKHTSISMMVLHGCDRFMLSTQGLQRRGSALPSFSTDMPVQPPPAAEQPGIGVFQPQVPVIIDGEASCIVFLMLLVYGSIPISFSLLPQANGHRTTPSADELSLDLPSARCACPACLVGPVCLVAPV